MPALIVQPLLENAVYHGIEPRAEGGTIHVRGSRENDSYVLVMENPLPNKGAPRSGGNHMALENIGARLEAFFGSDGLLETLLVEDRFRATLRLPMRGRA